MGYDKKAGQKWLRHRSKIATWGRMLSAYVRIPKSLGVIAIILCCVAVGWSAGNLYIDSQKETVYHVSIDGEPIGLVKEKAAVEAWMVHHAEQAAKRYHSLDIEMLADIEFTPEEQFNPAANLRATLHRLEERTEVRARAVRVSIDGEKIGYVASKEAVEAMINSMKGEYVPDEVLLALEQKVSKGKVKVASAEVQDLARQVLDVRIKEEIKLDEVLVQPNQVLDEEELEKALFEPKMTRQTYRVKEGDVLGSIAEQFDLSIAELLQLNPDLSVDQLLHIGQELTVKGETSRLTVVQEEQVTLEEKIPYKTEVKSDPDLYRGQTRIEQEGREGLKEVTYLITKENGNEVAREIINQRTLTEPVNRIVRRGEKMKASRGSGQFAWPARGGRVSSHFGPRWGRFHAGIDIAGVSNRTIVAADHGKVSTAGWHNGGYGNYIVIDHQNGYRTLYAHLASINVRPGQTVQKGEAIGVMGSTGSSTGVHLHFEVHQHGRPVNPLPFVR